MSVENPGFDQSMDEALKKESAQLNNQVLAGEKAENEADRNYYDEEARRELERLNSEESGTFGAE